MITPRLRRLLQVRTNSLIHSRFFSSGQKHVSPHIAFYQTFGRPIAKVFLMSTFIYQLTYWAWAKLEKDEIHAEKQAEIAALETKLQGITTREKP